MNILLIGERFSNNLGDGVIYDTVKNIIESFKIDNLNIICLDISGKLQYNINKSVNIKPEKKVLKFLRSKFSSIKRSTFVLKNIRKLNLNKIDIAIYAGGQLFSDYFAKQMYYINKVLNKHNIPIVYNSCGMGLNKKNKKYLLKAVNINNVIGVSIRDNPQKFKDFFQSTTYTEAMDPVYEISKFIPRLNHNSKLIGIGLMEPNAYLHNKIDLTRNEYFNLINIIVKKVENMGYNWEFFCNGNDDDFRFINEVCQKNGYSQDKINKRPVTPDELVAEVLNFDKIISFRLHSHIIASSYNIPCFGFEWDKKMKSYFTKLNNEKFCLKLNLETKKILNDKLEQFLKIKSEDFKYTKQKEIILSSEFLSNFFKVENGEKNE